jgi:hypothetical protein
VILFEVAGDELNEEQTAIAGVRSPRLMDSRSRCVSEPGRLQSTRIPNPVKDFLHPS